MTQSNRNLTDSGTPYYETTFYAITKNAMDEDDIKKVEDLIREIEIKNNDNQRTLR